MAAGRLAGVGALLGGAVTVEYPSLLAAAVIVSYAAVFVRPWHRLAWLGAGAALPLVGLAAYHAVAFGSPFALPYAFSTDSPRRQGALFGLGAPSPRVLYGILLSPYRGLFYSAPWLLLAIPGAVRLWRGGRFRAEAAVAVAVALLYVALNAGLVDWHGGWGTGPRHLVPALPFLALAAGGLLVGRTPWRAEAGAYGLAVAYSVVLMLVATSVHPEVPRWFGRPFGDYLFPAFTEGRLAVNTLPLHTGNVHERREASNAGEWLGLRGRTSLLPLAGLLALGGLWLQAGVKRSNIPDSLSPTG